MDRPDAPITRCRDTDGHQTACDSSARLHLVADLVETLFPAMERLGVATPADIGLETLAERMRHEALASDSVIVGRSEIGGWSRV